MTTRRSGALRNTAIAVTLLLTAGRTEAFAWGCDGHIAIAIMAAQLLGPSAVTAVQAVLSASSVDPALRRFCAPLPSDPIADAATWADDQRAAAPATAGWHFVNFPRAIGGHTANPAPYCRGGNCIVDAIVTQFQRLTTSRVPAERADALRFVIHFVGDIHQPLHAITNGDRGGNCFPVSYHGEPSQEDERGNFSPNLHGVWDNTSIATLMRARGLADARALAEFAVTQGTWPARVTAVPASRARVTSWAREANALARTIAYGRLAVPVPLEPAAAITLTSCRDNRDIGHRLLALHEDVSEAYEGRSVPVMLGQFRLAAIRLAETLKAAFP